LHDYLSKRKSAMKVLLAIDGSDCSLAAVKEVAARHWPEGTVIKILGAVTTWFPSTPDPLLIGAAMYQDLMETERKRLQRLVESTAAELRKAVSNGDLKIETAVLDGSPKEVIIDEAERWHADLVVVGCHGYGSVKRFMLGSVSQAVATHAPCSVEIVRSCRPTETAR
jgi:nucleotide-binding universal stress UspA family protein